VRAVRAAVCGSVFGSSAWQCARQCAAVRQCGSVRQCAAVRAAVCGSVWQCVAASGCVHGGVWQCALRMFTQSRSQYIYCVTHL
jgi:hypothetical protein